VSLSFVLLPLAIFAALALGGCGHHEPFEHCFEVGNQIACVDEMPPNEYQEAELLRQR
jgi:hypothetical protein